ncbi:MAG: OsmC family protein [Planctomycetota bacterium]
MSESEWPVLYSGRISWDGPGHDKDAGVAVSKTAAPKPDRAPIPVGEGATRFSAHELLISALMTCYMDTFLAIVGKHTLPIESFTCAAEGTLEPPGEKEVPRLTKVVLRPVVKVAADTPQKTRDRIATYLRRGEQFCYVRNALTTEVSVEPTVE